MSDKIPKFFEEFRAAYPDVAAHYNALSEATKKAGPLDERTVELLKLAIAMGAGAEGAAHSHARRALAAGVTAAQLEHVALLAITTLGFPRAMTGLAWVRDVTTGGR
jgi:AhpD family alkylhydroperoxidase